ncbi:hypothetical protein KCP73_25730 [Salmonella enterica subsp. enterica]|nr:hypothetical protein KCP73_25730 [Salmonella enterica subsp. enterica]
MVSLWRCLPPACYSSRCGREAAAVSCLRACCLTAGLGSGSTFQMIAVFRQITLYNASTARRGAMSEAQREAGDGYLRSVLSLPLLAYGRLLLFQKAFGASLALTGSPVGIIFCCLHRLRPAY